LTGKGLKGTPLFDTVTNRCLGSAIRRILPIVVFA
jgi:hypothetical protein